MYKARNYQRHPVPEPEVPELYELTKNTVIEMFELISAKKTSIISFLLLRQAALQSDQNEAFAALL